MFYESLSAALRKRSEPTQPEEALRVAFHPPVETGRLSSSRIVQVGCVRRSHSDSEGVSP
jgi:hypothetical protein